MSLADRVVLMRDGRIVQVGTPAELYDDPVNDFAAVFIGSPSMNLVPAELRSDGLYAGGQRVRLPSETAKRVGAVPPGPIQLGIRPHDVTPCKDYTENGVVEVSIVDSYSIGREQYFDFTLGEGLIKGIGDGAISPADIVGAKLDPAKLLLFTPDGGRIRV
jgi:multiple sugar transport system ATP-binding protein